MTFDEMTEHFKSTCGNVSSRCNTCKRKMLGNEQGSHDCVDFLLARNLSLKNEVKILKVEIKGSEK
jgi:hypothetical protein